MARRRRARRFGAAGGGAAAAKAGALRRTGAKAGGLRRGFACVPPKRGEQGKLCGGCFGSPRTGECRCRRRAEREEYSAGTACGEALVCLAAAGGVRGRHSGVSPALGNMTPRLSFSPGGGLCGRTSASARGGRFAPRGKCAERAETRRTRSAAPRKALLRRRDGEFGGEVAPEHACRGQRIGALRESAAARRERGVFSAGRVSPEGGRPAED